MRSQVDKLEVDKLLPVPLDLSKLSNVVKNSVVKEDEYNPKIKDFEDQIPDITIKYLILLNLATNATLNAKTNEIKNKIPSITNFATTTALNAKINEVNVTNLATSTTTALTAVENKIPDHGIYITTLEFNKLIAENVSSRLAQTNLGSKNDVTNFFKKADIDDELNNLNKKITSNKIKHILVESVFIGQSFFFQ